MAPRYTEEFKAACPLPGCRRVVGVLSIAGEPGRRFSRHLDAGEGARGFCGGSLVAHQRRPETPT